MGLAEKIRFWVSRRWREEELSAMSATQDVLMSDLAGKTVAIVGNARSLAEKELGAAIDAADVVIRINRAPMPDARSHGRKTTWVALATSMPRPDEERLRPERILWMSHKRKRLPYWVAVRAGFYLYPLPAFLALKRQLQAPPTTGLMIIDFVSRSEAGKIDLFGFDFFSSLSLTGSRTAAQVPHDFAAEKAWVEKLAARDQRLTIN